MPTTEDMTVRVDADTAPFASALKELQDLSKSFGNDLTNALKGAARKSVPPLAASGGRLRRSLTRPDPHDPRASSFTLSRR